MAKYLIKGNSQEVIVSNRDGEAAVCFLNINNLKQ